MFDSKGIGGLTSRPETESNTSTNKRRALNWVSYWTAIFRICPGDKEGICSIGDMERNIFNTLWDTATYEELLLKELQPSSSVLTCLPRGPSPD
jgi:hypothetical protein